MKITKKAIKEYHYKEYSFSQDFNKLILYNSDDDIIQFLKDVLSSGCVSGCVSGLIYYSETKKVFKKHFEDIMNFLSDDDIIVDDMINKNWLNYNTLIWIAFEEYCRCIMNEFDLEF